MSDPSHPRTTTIFLTWPTNPVQSVTVISLYIALKIQQVLLEPYIVRLSRFTRIAIYHRPIHQYQWLRNCVNRHCTTVPIHPHVPTITASLLQGAPVYKPRLSTSLISATYILLRPWLQILCTFGEVHLGKRCEYLGFGKSGTDVLRKTQGFLT